MSMLNANAGFWLTPTTDTRPHRPASPMASSMVASAPTASTTTSAPRPPVTRRTSPIGSSPTGTAPSAAARSRRDATRSTARTRAAAHHERCGHAHQAHRAHPHHRHRVAGGDAGQAGAVPAGGGVVGEHEPGVVAIPPGRATRFMSAAGTATSLGLAAAERVAHPVHPDLAGAGAQEHPAPAARLAAPAAHRRRQQHRVTHREALDGRSHLDDLADGLVADRVPGSGREAVTVVDVQVAAADARRPHRHDGASLAGQRGVGDGRAADVAGAVVGQGSHDPS